MRRGAEIFAPVFRLRHSAKERGMRFSPGIFGKLLGSLAGPAASGRMSKGAALSFAIDWGRRNEVEPGD
jgi:hypothetical protein